MIGAEINQRTEKQKTINETELDFVKGNEINKFLARLIKTEQKTHITNIRYEERDFPGDPVVKNPPANAQVPSLIQEDSRFHIQWSS